MGPELAAGRDPPSPVHAPVSSLHPDIPLAAGGMRNLASAVPPVIFAVYPANYLDTVALTAVLPPAWKKAGADGAPAALLSGWRNTPAGA